MISDDKLSDLIGRQACIFCGSIGIRDVIDLGMHPCADSFLKPIEVVRGVVCYPLVVQLCLQCGNAQNRYETPPLERYQKYDYSYTSSHSESSKSYWREYADFLLPLLRQRGTVVEVGSNDGYLLSLIARAGHRVVGVDASPEMVRRATEAGVQTICDLFRLSTAQDRLGDLMGSVNIVVANNVFNHSDDPNSFLESVTYLLSDSGFFIFESPYWLETLQSMRFDQIYHEHVTYPTIRAIRNLIGRHGLVIADAYRSNYHGGSMRIIARRITAADESPNLVSQIANETDANIFSPSFYEHYQAEITKRRNCLLANICQIRLSEPDAKIFCIGAAAKGNTFLNFYRLDRSLVDFVTDVSSSKIGKLTPHTNILIVPDEEMANYHNVYALLLSWNLSDKLQDIILKINPSVKFLA